MVTHGEIAAMGRPKKAAGERRDDRLPNIRVTAAERSFVEGEAEKSGLTLVEFCRRSILKIRIVPRASQGNDALLMELNRIGVNLNQIAHAVNAGRGLPSDFPAAIDELREALAKVLADGS